MRAEILFPGGLQPLRRPAKRVLPPALLPLAGDRRNGSPQPSPLSGRGGVAGVHGQHHRAGLRLAADALRPYAADIAARVDAGQLLLLTGNALDVFGQAIESDSADTIEGLGLLPCRARYQMMKRHNSFFLGSFEDMDVVGFKSLFGHSYDAPERDGWFRVTRGVGRNPDTPLEGYRRGGLMATYLIGPLLILNPPLCKWLLRRMNAPSDALAFEEAAMASYEKRVAEFRQESRNYLY